MANEPEHRQEKQTLDALVTALQAIPQADASMSNTQAVSPTSRWRPDGMIDLVWAGQHITLLVEVKRTVFPRDVPNILYQLNTMRKAAHRGWDILVPLLAAESISAGARAMLREENVGFFDTGGSLFVPAKGAYLYIDRPVPKILEKSVGSLFAGKRSQIIHALLTSSKGWVGVHEIAGLAEVSPATASETLTALERMDWVASRGQGPSKERRVTSATALLDEWRRQILISKRPLPRRRYYVGGGDIVAIARRLGELCEEHWVEYAMTQDFAAQHYSPFLSNISRVACRMAVGKGLAEVMTRLNARPVTEGANLDVIETTTRSEFLFKKHDGPLWYASPLQTYLDLLRNEGRSPEMAEHLRKEILRI